MCASNDLFTEDEGSRIKGRRITLSDINSNSLKWSPFNGTWINGESWVYRNKYIYDSHKFLISIKCSNISDFNRNDICYVLCGCLCFCLFYLDHELVYRDPTGGLSIISAVNFSTRILMSNSTFVSFPCGWPLRLETSEKQLLRAYDKVILISISLNPQRQLNAEKYLVSPDTQFVVLLADVDADGAR